MLHDDRCMLMDSVVKQIDVQGGVHLYHLIDDSVSVDSDRNKSSCNVIPCDSSRSCDRAISIEGSDPLP